MAEYYVGILMFIILGTFAIVGLARGFVKTIAGFACYILAYIVASTLYEPIAGLFAKIPFIANMVTEGVEMPVFTAQGGFFVKIGEIATFLFDHYVHGGTEAEMQAVLSNLLAEFLSKLFAFLALFIVAVLLLKLILLIIDKFCELPVLNAANRILGLLIGFLCGLFVTWILSNLYVNSLFAMLNNQWPDIFVVESTTTPIMQFFLKYNPIAFILFVIETFTVKKA